MAARTAAAAIGARGRSLDPRAALVDAEEQSSRTQRVMRIGALQGEWGRTWSREPMDGTE